MNVEVKMHGIMQNFADYGVAEHHLTKGMIRRREWDENLPLTVAKDMADKYNADEQERARMELREVRVKYVLIRHNHTFDLIEA